MISLSVFAIFANPFLSKYFAFSLSWPGTGFKRIKGTVLANASEIVTPPAFVINTSDVCIHSLISSV